MTNVIAVNTPIAELSVELLVRSLVLPMTVLRVPNDSYRGSGGRVDVRVRTPRLAKQQETPSADIDFDALEEHTVPVELEHWYNAALLADEEFDLHIVDFGDQVLAPQVAAVAEAAEDQLAGQMNAITPTVLTATDPVEKVLEARRRLTEDDVPLGRRYLAVGPQYAEALVGDPNLSDVSQAGSPSALRDAVVGKLYGFIVVESNGITTDRAIGYHESGFAFAGFAPRPARGAESSSVAAAQRVSVRASIDWVPTKLSHAAVVDIFTGAGTVVEDTEPTPTIKRAISFAL